MKQLPKKISCFPYATSVMNEVQNNRTKINEIIQFLNQEVKKLQAESVELKSTLRKICASREIMETCRLAREILEALNQRGL